MALLKNIEINNSGLVATYWRVTHVQVEFPPTGNDTMEVVLHGYANEEARRVNKAPLPVIRLTFSQGGGSFENLTRQSVYDLVKMMPEFEGASDIIDIPTQPEPDPELDLQLPG